MEYQLIEIIHEDNLEVMKKLDDNSIDLIYTDPPFHTKSVQKRNNLEVIQDPNGNRIGFGGNRYTVKALAEMKYDDNSGDYYGFLIPRLLEMYRVLSPTGSLFLHLDYREIHYVKILLDSLFGEDNFRNQINWTWDYGAKSKRYWPRKTNGILWYTKSDEYYFDIGQSDRLEYIAPKLVGAEKAERGKLPTDTWFISIVGTNSKEKTGYPSQKPEKLLERIVLTTSKEGDLLLDPFAGSGTLGAVANKSDRHCMLIDDNLQAIDVMKKRFNVATSPLDNRNFYIVNNMKLDAVENKT